MRRVPVLTPQFFTSIPALSGLKVWLSAADTSTLFEDDAMTTPASDTGVVGGWADKSGNGNHVVQATLENKPLMAAAAYSGKAAVRFDGSNDFLASASFGTALVQPNLIIAVAQMASNTAIGEIFDGTGTTRHRLLHTAGSSAARMGSNSTTASANMTLTTSIEVYTCLFNGTGSASWLNLSKTGGAISPGTENLGALRVGNNIVPDGAWHGDICEIIVLDIVPSDRVLGGLQGYLMAFYGAS